MFVARPMEFCVVHCFTLKKKKSKRLILDFMFFSLLVCLYLLIDSLFDRISVRLHGDRCTLIILKRRAEERQTESTLSATDIILLSASIQVLDLHEMNKGGERLNAALSLVCLEILI